MVGPKSGSLFCDGRDIGDRAVDLRARVWFLVVITMLAILHLPLVLAFR